MFNIIKSDKELSNDIIIFTTDRSNLNIKLKLIRKNYFNKGWNVLTLGNKCGFLSIDESNKNKTPPILENLSIHEFEIFTKYFIRVYWISWTPDFYLMSFRNSNTNSSSLGFVKSLILNHSMLYSSINNSFDFCKRMLVTLSVSKKVGKIMGELKGRDITPPTAYSNYM